MSIVAGIDGCRRGWVVVEHDTHSCASRVQICEGLSSWFCDRKEISAITIDMPIGLLDAAERGGRECERQARAVLRPRRASSVFSSPARLALSATSHDEASTLNRSSSPAGVGLSQQSFALFRKLREIDELVTPAMQKRVREVHPELCFAFMNGNHPCDHSKHTVMGREERLGLLEKHGLDARKAADVKFSKATAEASDVIDAFAACWTAIRLAEGLAVRVPEHELRDSKGLEMGMWV